MRCVCKTAQDTGDAPAGARIEPTDKHRDLCLELYRAKAKAFNNRDPYNKGSREITKWRMAKVIAKVEQDHNLVIGALKENTLMGHIRKGFDLSSHVKKRGVQPVLPESVELNLLKLVLAAEKRGDNNAGEM